MRHRIAIAFVAGSAAAAACRTPMNYTSRTAPRYAGNVAPALHAEPAPAAIRLVTFNIQDAREIDSAIVLLRSTTALANADIIALQEMDAAGTGRIAAALGMSYVYYPATVHPASGRDFGNAILSRWPFQDDAKVILPHLARFGKTQRIATAATILIGGVPIRVYSVHLATKIEQGPGARRNQVNAILADAANYLRVIVTGDMNSHGIGETFRSAGYAWPTEHNPRTEHWWNWDHVFLRGVALREGASTGVVRHNRHASDHHPVWAVVALQ